jgi:hypothetical protein
MVHTCGTSPVCLVDLVCFVYLVDLVHLVSFVQPNNQTDQTNQTTVFLCWWPFPTSYLGESWLCASQVVDSQQTQKGQPFGFNLTPPILFLPIYDH